MNDIERKQVNVGDIVRMMRGKDKGRPLKVLDVYYEPYCYYCGMYLGKENKDRIRGMKMKVQTNDGHPFAKIKSTSSHRDWIDENTKWCSFRNLKRDRA